MAREAPPQNTIYTGMLAVSLAAIVVGCFVLALEMTNDYDWTMEAKGGPAITLPAKTSPTPASGGGMAAVTLPKDTATAKAPAESAVKPETIPPPAALPVLASVPVIKAPEEKTVEASQPTLNQTQPKPTGIVPSPLKIPGDR